MARSRSRRPRLNLTTLGTADWAHWSGTSNHKATGGTQISNLTTFGAGNYGTSTNSTRNFSWTDGTPTASATNNQSFRWCNTAGAGWTFTAPASIATRTLEFVAGGAANAVLEVRAQLSDASAPDYMHTPTSTSFFTRKYTVTYSAASAGQTLTIRIKKVGDDGTRSRAHRRCLAHRRRSHAPAAAGESGGGSGQCAGITHVEREQRRDELQGLPLHLARRPGRHHDDQLHRRRPDQWRDVLLQSHGR